MDIKQYLRNKSFQLVIQIVLFSALSVNAHSASLPSVRPATNADIAHLSNPTVTSSNPAIATAAITGEPVIPGVHDLSISVLARADVFATARTYPTEIDALGIAEALTISAGSSEMTVNVNATDSLKDIAGNINATAKLKNLNVKAYLAQTGPGQTILIIASNQTGLANSIKISEIGLGTLDISRQLMRATDARFVFDSITFVSSSNDFVICGLEVNLLNVGEVTLTVNEI